MNTILVKIHNSKQTVAEATVVTKDGNVTTIKAAKRVNYEFIDQATGNAPHHIVIKRVAEDLHVSFEENGQVADLVIEGYYKAGETALIGLAEDGQYYYYVPDTANATDYVTELAVGDIEGQALGGVPYPAPWWMGATEKVGFPWVGLLAGVGGIIALSDDDDKGNRGADNGINTNPTPPTPNPNPTTPEKATPKVTAPTDGSAVITPDSDPHPDCTVITYTDESGAKQTIVVVRDKTAGTWSVNTAETTVLGVATTPTTDGKTPFLDTKTGVVTIPALAVQDKSNVVALHKVADSTGNKVDAGRDDENVGDNPSIATPPTNPPVQTTLSPVVVTQLPDGFVSFSLIKDTTASRAVVKDLTAPDGSKRDVVFTKEAGGAWKSEDPTIQNWKVETDFKITVQDTKTKALVYNVPAVRFVIPANEVKDQSPFTVEVIDDLVPSNVIVYRPPSDNTGTGGDSTTDTTAPALVLAGSTTGETVELTYNEKLDGNNPAVERFTVSVDGQQITINGVTISDSKVTIALKDPVVLGKTIKVTYDDPTALDDPRPTNGKDPLQDVAGNDVPDSTIELTAGMYTAQSDMIDFGLIGDVNMIDLGMVNKASLHNVTHANVTTSNNNGLFIKGDVGDTITLGTVLDTGSSAIQVDATGSWTKGDTPRQGSTVAGDDSTYNIWTHSDGIMLYIDADMTVL